MKPKTLSSCEIALLVASLALLLNTVSGVEINYKNPVRSAAEDEVKYLPGYVGEPINFKHYSGYLAADDRKPTNKFLHYWLVESQSEPDQDPLVLWLNGGPGCSSLFGLLTELGPFQFIEEDETLVENEFAWNKRANVLFLESPAGTGFSYAVDRVIETDDDLTATQNHLALKSFMQKFAKFNKRPLYLTGESYAGVYLPTLAVLLDKDPEFNLKGVAIGNGYMNHDLLQESRVFYSYHHGLIGETKWAAFSKFCCNGQTPSLGHCNYVSNNILEDYGCFKLSNFGIFQFDGLDQYNILAKYRGNEPEENLNMFMRQPTMRKALHIPQYVDEFNACAGTSGWYKEVYPNRPDGLAPQLHRLMESPRNLSLLSYNGDLDLVCNFLGVQRFVEELKRPTVKEFGNWMTDGQVSGFVKYFDRITFLTVKGAGHMVPTDKPAETLNMFHMFLDGMFAPKSIQRHGADSLNKI